MMSPFPGMDPYLESRLLWHDVHQRLAGQISQQLAPQLAPRYVARLETYFVTTSPDYLFEQDVAIIYPDVDVAQARRPSLEVEPRARIAVAVTPAPLVLTVAMPERLKLVTVELRDVAQRRLVTAIEIISPVNKRGDGLEEYRNKREMVLSAEAHLLEIDLLRKGTRPPSLIGLPQSDYFVFLTRAQRTRATETWPTSVRDALPIVPVPLLPGDDDALLDLGHALQAIYDQARYDLSIDYGLPSDPPLAEADAAWARTLSESVHR